MFAEEEGPILSLAVSASNVKIVCFRKDFLGGEFCDFARFEQGEARSVKGQTSALRCWLGKWQLFAVTFSQNAKSICDF